MSEEKQKSTSAYFDTIKYAHDFFALGVKELSKRYDDDVRMFVGAEIAFATTLMEIASQVLELCKPEAEELVTATRELVKKTLAAVGRLPGAPPIPNAPGPTAEGIKSTLTSAGFLVESVEVDPKAVKISFAGIPLEGFISGESIEVNAAEPEQPQPEIDDDLQRFVEFAKDPRKWNQPQPEVSAHLQWQGTNACLDFQCSCGVYTHWDDEFLYALKCPGCDSVWKLSTDIEVTRATEQEQTGLCHCLKTYDVIEDDETLDAINESRRRHGLAPRFGSDSV